MQPPPPSSTDVINGEPLTGTLSLSGLCSYQKSLFGEIFLGRGKSFCWHKRGTKGGPLSRPITRGLLNKVVKLMWDEIRMGRCDGSSECHVRSVSLASHSDLPPSFLPSSEKKKPKAPLLFSSTLLLVVMYVGGPRGVFLFKSVFHWSVSAARQQQKGRL